MKILGISSSNLIFSLTDALIEKDSNESLELIDEIAKAGIDFSILISQLLAHFRDLMLVKTLRQPEKIVFSTYIKDFDLQANKIELREILEIIEILKNLSIDMRYAENKRVLIEMTAIKISMRYTEKELIARIEELEKKINSNDFINKPVISNLKKDDIPQNEKSKVDISTQENYMDTYENTATPKEMGNPTNTQNIEKDTQSDIIREDISIEDIQKNWPNILQEVKVKKLPLFSYLKEGVPISFTNNVLEIDFSNTNIMFYKMCNNDENKEVIAQVFEAIYGFRIEVRFIFKQTKANNKLEDLFGKDNIEEI